VTVSTIRQIEGGGNITALANAYELRTEQDQKTSAQGVLLGNSAKVIPLREFSSQSSIPILTIMASTPGAMTA
jgi:hypothetical protein